MPRAWIEVVGIDRLSLMLQRGEEIMGDWRPVFDQAAVRWYREAAVRFRSGDAGSWAPLSKRRISERYKHGFSAHPILVEYGDLYSAATGGTNGTFWGKDITGYRQTTFNSMTMGLAGDKVAHNFGFVNDEGKKVPKREFWGWTHPEQDILWEPFVQWTDRWLAGPP